MKKILLLLSLFCLTSCGPPPSLLDGQQDNSFVGRTNATLVFDWSGTFTLNQTWPFTCDQAGTWNDLNPGNTAGSVTMTYTIDTCNIPSLVGTNQTYTYVISQGNLVINPLI